jgi:alpha-beta hydrolase superfamily lysophospholipase
VGGAKAFLVTPKNAGPEWVWYAPTIFEKSLPGKTQDWIFSQLLRRGISVAGVDVGESFGAPAGRKLYSEFYDAVTHQFRLSTRPCLLAQSRGGLMVYDWAEENPERVKCIAGIYPVVNLNSWPPPGSDDEAHAAAAYGMAVDEFRQRRLSLSPIGNIAPLAKSGVSILHLHGDHDALVPLEANSLELSKLYRQYPGAAIELVVIPGKGHEETDDFFKSQRLIDFLTTSLASNSPH